MTDTPQPAAAEIQGIFAEYELSFVEPPEEASEAEAERECNRLLAALKSVRDNKAANHRLHVEEIQRADRWLARVNSPLDTREAWLIGMLEAVAPFVGLFGKAKSRDLPHGRLGWRTKPERIEVEDAAAALAWAKGIRGITVKSVETVSVQDLSRAWKEGRVGDPSFVPPGCKVVDASETFYVEPSEVA